MPPSSLVRRWASAIKLLMFIQGIRQVDSGDLQVDSTD